MSVFKSIQRDPDICSNCFRRTHDRFDRRYAVDWVYDPSEQDYDFWPRLVDRGESVRRRRGATTKVPADEASQGLVTTCECGARWQPPEELDDDETWKFRPLDRDAFFETAGRLADRVREIPRVESFDEQTYWSILEDRKTDPDEQFADDDIFQEAVERSTKVRPQPAADGRKHST